MDRIRLRIMIALTFALCFSPLVLFAAPHAMGDGTVMLGGMDVPGEMQKLTEQTADGVKAIVHLKDIKTGMAKMKMPQTHHFLITFVDVQNKRELAPSAVDLKIMTLAGKELAQVKLTAMPSHAGADITLAAAGDYKFVVAAKLENGKKLQYEFDTLVK